jgi:23S rRNA (cytidine1920-2'-O)/16S rRNA (cytidine1409-2'-O)-methyltransferase
LTTPKAKVRLDRLLVEKGLASTVEKARALIYAGQVRVNEQPAQKPGKAIDPQGTVEVRQPEYPYVSRGGVKLKKALEEFQVKVAGKVALDIGASTGGFTHCLLLEGAKRVYAVDVGYGQLAWEIRQDPRVTVLERKNARFLTAADIGESADLAVVDTSFISLKLIVPALIPFLKAEGEVIALIKPQFEVGKGKVGKGGVVRQWEDQKAVLEELTLFFTETGWSVADPIESPILGAKGNREFLMYLRKGEKRGSDILSVP